MYNQFKELRFSKDKINAKYDVDYLVANANIASKSTIYKYESGEMKPGFDALKGYKEFFNCSYEYLFRETKLPEEKFKYITQDSVLGNLNSDTINTLNNLLSCTFSCTSTCTFLDDGTSIPLANLRYSSTKDIRKVSPPIPSVNT